MIFLLFFPRLSKVSWYNCTWITWSFFSYSIGYLIWWLECVLMYLQNKMLGLKGNQITYFNVGINSVILLGSPFKKVYYSYYKGKIKKGLFRSFISFQATWCFPCDSDSGSLEPANLDFLLPLESFPACPLLSTHEVKNAWQSVEKHFNRSHSLPPLTECFLHE